MAESINRVKFFMDDETEVSVKATQLLISPAGENVAVGYRMGGSFLPLLVFNQALATPEEIAARTKAKENAKEKD